MTRISPPLKTTLIYALFGFAWIIFSDRFLGMLTADPHLLTRLQSYKGIAYVFFTSLLLFTLIRRDYRRLLAQEEEKRRLFATTMRAVQHILNNFLQSMVLFKVELQNAAVRPGVEDLFEKVIFSTRDEIAKLSALEAPSEDTIKRTVYPT